jgi:two-component system, OmpR family, alkaline phosphatase synthesis response regulator PhoP
MTKKILIIEDDELLREIYATKLELEGFEVETAYDGVDGLEKAILEEPNMILLDMIMPRMTGLEFLRVYRPSQLHPRVATVVMSNKSSNQEINLAKELGVIEYLIKSQHTPDDIVARVRNHLSKAH